MIAVRIWIPLLLCGGMLSGCDVGGQWFLQLRSSGRRSPDAGSRNRAPVLTAVYAAPVQTDVGAQIALGASAEDPDGDRISYRWTCTGGKIADATSPNTTFTCEQHG